MHLFAQSLAVLLLLHASLYLAALVASLSRFIPPRVRPAIGAASTSHSRRSFPS